MSKRESHRPAKSQAAERSPARPGADQTPLNPALALQQAQSAVSRGDWANAEQWCRRILMSNADYFDALSLLGIIALQGRRFDEAAGLLARAVTVRPGDAAAHNNYGIALARLMRFEDTLASYRRALRIEPDFAEAHYNLGNALKDLRRFDEALHSYERAYAIKPTYAEAYNNHGFALQQLERLDGALASYARALELKPDYAGAHYNRGNALAKLGRLDEALHSYERAVAIRPDSAEACRNRGLTLHALARFDDALGSYERALAIKPDYAEAHFDRGVTLHTLKRFGDALASYDRALEIRPDYTEAHYNRGLALQELHRFAEALASYEQVLKIRPEDADAHNNRGSVLQHLHRLDDALDSFGRALKMKPDHAGAHTNRGNALALLKRLDEAQDNYTRALEIKPDFEWLPGIWLHTKTKLCDWNGLDSRLANLVGAIERDEKVTPPWPALTLVDSPPIQRRAAEIWTSANCPARQLLPPIGKHGRRDRIRIGYCSSDFHNHATAYLMAELIERHDRTKFELVAISFGPDADDEMRRRLLAAFDRFIDVRTKSDQEIARISRSLGIDIAVDLKGFTRDDRARVFSHRAAPIQVNYLGYPGTMGAPYIDYLIADQTLIPAQSRIHYAEKIVYLPNCYQVNDRKRRITDGVISRAALGLPPGGFVFCCFNNSYKMRAKTFDGWMRILRQVEGSVLWLSEHNPTAAANLRREAEARGVSGARLVFAAHRPQADHLARYRAADLFLDTLPCNAHTTASDALWAGVPVVTLIGESLAARVGASLLNAVGLPELITATQDRYEALAIELATDADRLAGLREKLAENRLTTALFDTERFTRHIEDAYGQMFERYQADLAPDHIYVSA